MYAQLGNIRFEGQKGFTSFSHERGVNYAQHERINGKPRLQSVGDNLDTISFEMYLHSEFTNPENDIDALVSALEKKEVLLLLLGNGKIVGDFVITNFSQTNSFTDPLGNLISATLSISLLESFNDDKAREAEKKAISNAFANQLRNSNVRSVLPAKLSNGMGLTKDVSKIQNSSQMINMDVLKAKSNPPQSANFSKRIIKSLNDIEKSITSVQEKYNAYQNFQNSASNLPNALNDIYSRVQDLRSVMPITNIENVNTLANRLNNSTKSAKRASINITNSSIIRKI
jgi:phage protein U